MVVQVCGARIRHHSACPVFRDQNTYDQSLRLNVCAFWLKPPLVKATNLWFILMQRIFMTSGRILDVVRVIYEAWISRVYEWNDFFYLRGGFGCDWANTDAVWRVLVWCEAVWCHNIWSNVVRCVAVCCDAVCCGALWCSELLCRSEWHSMQ